MINKKKLIKLEKIVDVLAFFLAFCAFLVNSILYPSLWSIAITILAFAQTLKTYLQFLAK